MCAFAIQRSKGAFPVTSGIPFSVLCLAAGSENLKGSSGSKRINPVQEFYMSARNGDKSRFHRVRKQKIARRKRVQELLEGPANARLSVGRRPRQGRELS